jgi:trypsin
MKSQVLSFTTLLLASNLGSISSADVLYEGTNDVGLPGLPNAPSGLRGQVSLEGESSELLTTEESLEGEPEEQARQDTRIINGRESTPHEYPFAVSLSDDQGHFCGGSLITRNAVLTAAHCQGGRYKAVIGRHDLDTSKGQTISMRAERPHPQYDEYSTDSDFMLVFLRRPATINEDVKLVKLNDDPSVPGVGDRTTVMGWGDTHISDNISKLSDVLMKVQVQVMSNTECDKSSGSVGGYSDNYNDQITPRMLCAKANRKDSCQGDSGGPLVAGARQVGVVSWGISCASDAFPGVYARVSSAYGWIEKEVCRENRQYATEAGFTC